MKFHNDTPKICLQIAGVKILVFEVGGVFKIFSNGGSVESAIAAKVSIIRLIHKSYTALRGHSPKKMVPITTVSKTDMLTVT